MTTSACRRILLPFNSLSRDHLPLRVGSCAGRHQVCYSFNSLSRDHLAQELNEVLFLLRPFNSLSRDHVRCQKDQDPRFLQSASFNSLSRDHDHEHGIAVVAVHDQIAFNSLSRDHRKRTFAKPSIPKPIELSTPSLGITEPDSGIFRLSAAFCRGTPSHK